MKAIVQHLLAGHALRALWADQRVRFLFVGAWNTLVSYLIFVVVHLGAAVFVGEVVVITMAYLLALPLAFYMQKRFVFGGERAWKYEFRRFVLANSVIFFSNLLFLPLFVRWTGLGPLISQAVFVSCSTVLSYLAHKHYSFSR